MSANLIDDLLAQYCRALKEYAEAVIRRDSEEDVQVLVRSVMNAAAVFDDEMFARYGVTTPIEREWFDESEESEDATELNEERLVARVRFLSTGFFTETALRALDTHAEGWVAIAGGLGLEIEQFDVRVEPVDDNNWDG